MGNTKISFIWNLNYYEFGFDSAWTLDVNIIHASRMLRRVFSKENKVFDMAHEVVMIGNIPLRRGK